MKTARLEDANRSDNMMLNVGFFGDTSSIKYSSRRDVIAINTKIFFEWKHHDVLVTITLLFKVISGCMFLLDLVILRPVLTFVLPDTVHTLGSHRVYISRIHLVKTFRHKF